MKTYWYTAIIGFILFAFTIKAAAEGVQAPLIFDYGAFKGPAIMESEVIKTTGTVKSISAYWDFEGKTSMEVSANAGRAYVKIGNGTILKEGFIPGNELRFRATLGEKSILKKVILGYTDSSGIKRLPQNADLANYKNHQLLNVTGSPEELFDYPLKVVIDKNDLSETQQDYRDIRFIAADGATELEYYYEPSVIASAEGAKQSLKNEIASLAPLVRNDDKVSPRNDTRNVIANPPKADEAITFWVKVPQIPKNADLTLYLYYGNPQAASKSNAEKVFAFYDDFNGASLNAEKWLKTLGLKGDCSVKDGYLELRDASILSANYKIKEGIVEFKAKADENTAIEAVFQQAQEKSGSGIPFKEIFYSSAYPGAEHTIAINDVAKLNIGKPIQAQEEYIYKVIIAPSAAIFERYSAQGEKEVEVQFLDAGALGQGYIGLKADGDGRAYYDWIRVRPYVAVEPQVTLLMGG